MFVILLLVIAMVAWSLHLMQEAIEHQEFSMMLAGLLVAAAASGMVSAYILMNHYMAFSWEVALS
jgi:hypothetical protein